MHFRKWTLSLLLALACAGSAWAQDAAPAPATPTLASAIAGVTAPVAPSAPAAAPAGGSTAKDWVVEIDPLRVWLPSFSSSVTVPELPDVPSPPGGADGKTDSALSGAWMFGFRAQKSQFVVRGNFLYAGLEAQRQSPHLRVDLTLKYGEAFAGWAPTPRFSIEGGVRMIGADAGAEILTYPRVSTSPTLWDPLIGATYRQPLGKAWLLSLHGDGGGFGVGSDMDFGGEGSLEWTPSSHFGLSLGYQVTYMQFSHTVLQSTSKSRELKLGVTLAGPTLGIRFLF